MDNFNKYSDNKFSIAGLDLRRMVGLHVQFYKSLAQANTPSVATSAGYIQGVDSFLDSFVKHYQSNKEFRSGLIVQMMQAFVMKLDRAKNPMYGSKVLNCFFVLAASRKMKAFEFVWGNLVMLSKRYCQRIMAKKRLAPIIDM